MGITLTEKAANEVKRIIADQKIEPEMNLRVGVTGGGCSGFSYVMGFDTQDKPGDIPSEFHGLKVVLDGDAAPYLDNTVVEDRKSVV